MLLNLKIFVCVIIILILGMPVYGCKSDLKKQPIESAPEIEEEPSEEATPISEENEKEVRPNKEKNEEEETAENQDEIKDYSNKTELVYACSYIGGNPGKLIIEVDLAEGSLAGKMEMELTGFGLEGSNTKICYYKVTGYIEGVVNANGKVEGTFIGQAVDPGGDCQKFDVKYEVDGEITEKHDYLVGNFTTEEDKVYDFITKIVED